MAKKLKKRWKLASLFNSQVFRLGKTSCFKISKPLDKTFNNTCKVQLFIFSNIYDCMPSTLLKLNSFTGFLQMVSLQISTSFLLYLFFLFFNHIFDNKDSLRINTNAAFGTITDYGKNLLQLMACLLIV